MGRVTQCLNFLWRDAFVLGGDRYPRSLDVRHQVDGKFSCRDEPQHCQREKDDAHADGAGRRHFNPAFHGSFSLARRTAPPSLRRS